MRREKVIHPIGDLMFQLRGMDGKMCGHMVTLQQIIEFNQNRPAIHVLGEEFYCFFNETIQYLVQNYTKNDFPFELVGKYKNMSLGRVCCWVFAIAATATRDPRGLYADYSEGAQLVADMCGVVEFFDDHTR